MVRSKKVVLAELEYRVKKDVETQEFAIAFLSVYNNVRENPNVFFKMEMTYDSQLFLYVQKDNIEAVKDWMKWFSDVWDIDNVIINDKFETTVIVDYDDVCHNNIMVKDSVDIDDL